MIEMVVVMAMTGAVTVSGFLLANVLQGSTDTSERSYAQSVALSVSTSVRRQAYITYPTNSGYAVNGTDANNTRSWPVSLQVDNHSAGAAPVWAPDYPDSGFQRLKVVVTNPNGHERAAVEFFKWR